MKPPPKNEPNVKAGLLKSNSKCLKPIMYSAPKNDHQSWKWQNWEKYTLQKNIYIYTHTYVHNP